MRVQNRGRKRGRTIRRNNIRKNGWLKAATLPSGKQRATRLYRIWGKMRGRCYSKSNHAYKWYGQKGVSIEWPDFQSFRDWAVANGYGPGLTIDRIDPAGNYSAANCRWVTKGENSRRGIISAHRTMGIGRFGGGVDWPAPDEVFLSMEYACEDALY